MTQTAFPALTPAGSAPAHATALRPLAAALLLVLSYFWTALAVDQRDGVAAVRRAATQRLVERSRAIDELARATVYDDNRLQHLETTAESDTERLALRALQAKGNTGEAWRSALAGVRAAQSDALREAFDTADSATLMTSVAIGCGFLLNAGAWLLLLWPSLVRWRTRQALMDEPRVPTASVDVTQQAEVLRRRLEELYTVRRRAAESDRFAVYGELAAGLSHGLKTPLASTRAVLELALTRLPHDHPAGDNILDAIEEVDGLIEQIRRFLSAAGEPTTNSGTVDLGVYAQTLAAHYRDACNEAGVTIDVQADALVLARADGALLDIGVRNLLENAIAAAPRGSAILLQATACEPPPHVGVDQVAPKSDEQFVELAVCDAGAGMSVTTSHHLQPKSTKRGGSGLGIAIARRIVARHGGALHIRQRTPKGTEVHVMLPRVVSA